MTKYGSNYMTATTNRGVEAKELEITNTRLEHNTNTSSSSLPAEGSTLDSSRTSPPTADVTGSYVQVVVQKHRRQHAATAAQTSPRLPQASSPIRQMPNPGTNKKKNLPEQAGQDAGAGDGVVLLPASVLLCAAAPPHHPLSLYQNARERYCTTDAATSARAEEPQRPSGTGQVVADAGTRQQKSNKNSTWKILGTGNTASVTNFELSENAPEQVEVYYFEHGSPSYLATCGARRETRVERAGRRGARAAGACLAELLAAGRLALALPVALLLSLQRCVAMAARDLVSGSVQTLSDYLLKPALALVFNALVQPPLVCAGNALRATRDALRPVFHIAADAAEPLARLLSQVRLVNVCVEPRCRCARDTV